MRPTRSVARLIPIAFTITALLTACGSDASGPRDDLAGPAFASAGDPPQVPFRLTVKSESSTAAPGGRCGPFPMITLDLQGIAVSTLLGRTTVQQSHCIDAFDPSMAFTDGHFLETGADGSTVHGIYHGAVVPGSDPTIGIIQGVWTIIGGTGRTAGATGSGVAIGTLDFVTNRVTLELVGTISSVGSGKRR
jgi:hypothetical protein